MKSSTIGTNVALETYPYGAFSSHPLLRMVVNFRYIPFNTERFKIIPAATVKFSEELNKVKTDPMGKSSHQIKYKTEQMAENKN